MKISEEKKKELREVKECCKIDLGEFKDRFTKLSKFDKTVVSLAILDEDYEYIEEKEEDLEKNKEVIAFLQTEKEVMKQIHKSVKYGDKVIDEDGNEYDINHGEIDIYTE